MYIITFWSFSATKWGLKKIHNILLSNISFMPSISSPLWVNSVHFAHMHSLLSSTDPYLGAILHSYTWVPKESALLYVLIQSWPWRNGRELCELETQPEPPVAKAPSLPGLDWVGSLQDSLFLSPCSIRRQRERRAGCKRMMGGDHWPCRVSEVLPPEGGTWPSRAQLCCAAIVMKNAITAPEGGSHTEHFT